jgi:hypothetical protein
MMNAPSATLYDFLDPATEATNDVMAGFCCARDLPLRQYLVMAFAGDKTFSYAADSWPEAETETMFEFFHPLGFGDRFVPWTVYSKHIAAFLRSEFCRKGAMH